MKCLDFSVKNLLSRLFFRVLCRLLPVIFIFQFAPVQAVEVEGLYQGTVTVESRNDERERLSAFSNVFRQVLIKVTGNSEVLTLPQIRRALNNADDYVDTWSYRSISESDSALTAAVDATRVVATAQRVELTVSFFEPEVLSLLETANIPLWPGNRPYTLVWLVVQEELGARQIVGASTNAFPDVMALLDLEANNRALPILLPILDFEDMRAVSANDVWDMDAEKLLQASRRYQSESVLVIRLFRTVTGDVFGKSNHLFRDQIFEVEMFEQSAESFIQESVALATDEISAYYAVLLSGTDSSIEVNLTVEGIKSAEDYAALLDYVANLTDVNDYQVAAVENQTIMLRLSTGGQIRQLVETIALSRTLEPLDELIRNDNQVFMSYQWNN
jgi:uncharacterized protein